MREILRQILVGTTPRTVTTAQGPLQRGVLPQIYLPIARSQNTPHSLHRAQVRAVFTSAHASREAISKESPHASCPRPAAKFDR
jgi:hypothetical protein